MNLLFEKHPKSPCNGLNIYISYHNTSIGELIIGTFEGNICIIDFRDRTTRQAIDRRIKKYTDADFVVQENNIIRKAKQQIEEYLEGTRQQFTISILLLGSTFQQKVWQELLKLTYGETASYSEIAKRINQPKAVRTTASAIKANAVALIVPCHRVIAAHGRLGGFSGGLPAKKQLLNLENSKEKS